MAGRRPVPAEQAMDNLNQIITIPIGSTAVAPKMFSPLLLAERDYTIEDARLWWSTAESTATTLRAVLRKVASGSAMDDTKGGAGTTAVTLTGSSAPSVKGTAATVNVFTFAVSNGTGTGLSTGGVAPSANIVAGDSVNSRGTLTRGELLFLSLEQDSDGDGVDPTELKGLVVTLRVSTRRD